MKQVSRVLASLVALDATLAFVAFGFPQLWFTIFHGVDYADPQGFLRRCGANWLAFCLLQIMALAKWRREPHWLVLIAGVRLSDIFTDWTYLYFAHDITWFGRITLFTTSPANLVVGIYLLRAYKMGRVPVTSGR
ncbi:MAG: hypothetical protein HY074_02080 [Deltaproteobacteria bacterium]|nr:hypothetical protein [Deltaproteobacteria bacterium]